MNRSLKLSVMVALALASTPALALDLGQIQVKSALGRPLVAEIPLQPDHPGEADHVKAILAPDAAFARAGVNRGALKVPLSFAVVTTDAGQKVIRVTSTEPVREPYLDFLVQVTWPKGKLLREYTVLLDPLSMQSAPGVAPAKTPAPTPVATQTAASAAPEATPAPAQGPAEAASTPSDAGDYGPVAYGDTLSHIARTRAVDGVSYQQMLVALKAANPDAFFHDNVNALKTGAVLRIPTRAQALTVTRSSAIAAVRSQNQSWQSRHASSAPTMVASAGGSSTPVSGSDSSAADGDRLHLVSPEAGGASAGAADGGDATAAELRQDLARSKEALSSEKQASADLQSRVAALEQIADKNQRLLALKNDAIAALQQKLADARQAAGLPALPASALAPAHSAMASAASTAVAAPLASAGSAGKAAMASAASSQPAAAATAAGHAATATADEHASSAQAATPAAASSALWYEALWARVVLGIIILVLIVWMLLRRRKPASTAPRKSLADDFGDSPLGADATDDDIADHDDEPAETLEPAVDNDGEDELLAQLAEHPDNVGLHLELASLYYARRDSSHFEGAAEAMHAYVDDESQPEWQDVLAMGSDLVPDHPLFLAYAPADEASSDHFADGDEQAPVAEATHEDNDHHGFDFELTPEPPVVPTSSSDDLVLESESPTTSLPDESEFDALPPLPIDDADDDEDMTILSPVAPEPEQADAREDASAPAPASSLDTPSVSDDSALDLDHDGFSDDPVDTKLDLARAYMDMGDHEGARAMLTEAVREGTQMQKDTAQKLLDQLD